jgi:predicted PurR-regulated permease PerM
VLFTQTLGLISGIVALITVFVLSFYLLIDESGIKRVYQGLIPSRYYDNLAETTRKIAVKLGAWLRGQLLMMLSVAGIVTIGLLLSGTPYALTLGIWAGLTEVVPIIGPWLGAIPGVIVALTVSPWHGLIALIIYILVQQFESNFLVPRIMSKAVGLNPVVVIIALLIGGKLYGILGVLLGVPLAAVVSVVVEDWPVLEETFTTSRSK